MDHEVVNGNDGELVYTLDEALSSVGFGKFQALVLVYAGLGAMAEAMELMILSFIGPAVKTEWGLSPGQESLISTMVFAGMLIGSYMWGVISDNCGRRIGLLSVAVVTSLFAVFSSFSPSYLALIIFRVLVGIGVGGGPVYSSWFLEFVPVQNRGVWMVFYSTFWTMGTILEATLAWIVIPSLGWRWLLVLSSVPCLAAFFLYFLTIESPRYLYMNGRIIEAQNILRKMASVNKMELPSGILVSDEIPEQLDEESSSEESPLLSPRNLKITKRKPGGQTNCSISKSLQSKLTDSSLYRNVLITSFAEVPGIILSGLLVEKVGRKISMVLMYALGFIFLLPLIFQQSEVLTTSMLFGARMCTIGTIAVAGVYCPEIYPTSVRTTGCGVATAIGRVAGMLCPLVAVGLVSGCHQMAAIGLFETVIVLSGISVMLFPIETNGRELNDIAPAVK